MAMEISLSRLIGFCVSLALSVLFTGMFVYALYTLRNRKKVSDVSSVVTAALVVMFLLNTAQLCLQAADVYLAFFEWKGAGGPSGYFLDYGSKILPARDFIFWIEGLVTDAVVCWRLYVIWLRRKDVMIVPLFVLLGGFVSGVIMFLYTIRRMINDSTALIPVIDKWWEITLGFTIAINVIVPGMIVGRLWFIARQLELIGSNSVRPYKQVALALMESGALYTVAVMAWLIIFLSGSLPALYMGACILPTVVAIVPTLIVLRINTFSQSQDNTTAGHHSHRLDVKVDMSTVMAPTTRSQMHDKGRQYGTIVYDGRSQHDSDRQVDSYYEPSVSSLSIEGHAGDDALPTGMMQNEDLV